MIYEFKDHKEELDYINSLSYEDYLTYCRNRVLEIERQINSGEMETYSLDYMRGVFMEKYG